MQRTPRHRRRLRSNITQFETFFTLFSQGIIFFLKIKNEQISEISIKFQGGVVLLPEDVGERLIPRFGARAEDMELSIREIPNGSIDQLKELVKLVSSGEVSVLFLFNTPHTRSNTHKKI